MLTTSYFSNFSIQNKIRVLALFTTAFILTATSTALVSAHLAFYRHNMINQLMILSDFVGINSLAGLLFNDPTAIQENVAALRADPQVTFAYILDQSGAVFVDYHKEEDANRPRYDYDLHRYYPTVSQNQVVENTFFISDTYIDVFRTISDRGKQWGIVHIRAQLDELRHHILLAILITLGILILAVMGSMWIAFKLQKFITTPILQLLGTMHTVAEQNIYTVRATKIYADETGQLIDGFNDMLSKIEQRDLKLEQARQEILLLNEKLKSENLRMSAELEVTRRLQAMVLPRKEELLAIPHLDIVGYMSPAEEVGGDYYDVIPLEDGGICIGIGDVTGHGLESGVLMMMVQTAVHTLVKSNITDNKRLMNILNETILDNVGRMGSDKNLTFSLIQYEEGKLHITGQHEEVLIFRRDGRVERINTLNLGFMLGVLGNIGGFISEVNNELSPGDGILLYTDGITEAFNDQDEMYGLERMCRVVRQNWDKPSAEILQCLLNDVQQHTSGRRFYDDVTVVIMKRRQ